MSKDGWYSPVAFAGLSKDSTSSRTVESPTHAHLREWSERRVCIGLDPAKKGMVNIIYVLKHITFVYYILCGINVFYMAIIFYMKSLHNGSM